MPETLVRVQLDRGELRYTWTDETANARASDDGGPLPPKGWWLANLTRSIDERSSVRGHAMFAPFFPNVLRSGVPRGHSSQSTAEAQDQPAQAGRKDTM